MAKLLAPVKLPDFDYSAWSREKQKTYDKKVDKILEGYLGVLRFPIADGYAMYAVQSVSPPVLRHVPCSEWQVDPALIRGLRAKDIQIRLDLEREWKKLFSAKAGT